MKLRHFFALALTSGLLVNAGCSSDDDKTPTGPLGGPVTGTADAHCTSGTPVEVVADACTVPGGEKAQGGAPGAPADCNETHDDEYGETQFNSEADDDDCKYHVSWTSTPIRLDQDVTVTLTTSNLTTHQPVEALADRKRPLSRVEVYQPCDPTRRGPLQNSKAEFTETAPGVYTGGPLRFDQKGRWVVRYHFYEQCFDGEGSPHGHIAFFVDVP